MMVPLLPRWVEDDSPLTAAPLLTAAGFNLCPLPFLWPCNFCSPAFWKYKYRLVGCWPFNGNLGRGYLSKALVISGYQAGISGGPPTTIDPLRLRGQKRGAVSRLFVRVPHLG